jgi:hypothetical protein
MKVNDRIYYHINTGKPLHNGDEFKIGDSPNNFCKELYNLEFGKWDENNDWKCINEIIIEMQKKNNLTFHSNEDFKIAFRAINDYAAITRELIFEEVRKEYYSDLPSRLRGLFVCSNLDRIEEWLNIFKRTNKRPIQVLKLKLNGNIFIGDASFILRQNKSLNYKTEQAKKYWNGDKINNIEEIIFEGMAEVIEIVKSIE